MDWLTKYAEIPDRERIRRIAELINESRAAVSDAERGLLEAALAATKERLQ